LELPFLDGRELLALYDDTMRCNAHPAGLTREAGAFAARYTAPSGSLRFILWHRFAESRLDEAINAEIAAARGHAEALMWKVYAHDTPAKSLEEKLVASGFKPEEPSALLIASVSAICDALGTKRNDVNTLNVRELDSAASLDTYLEIWNDVWPDSPNERYVNDYRALVADRDPGVTFFAGFSGNNEPVTSGYMFHHPNDPIALLCGGATKAHARGHGAYAQMLAARANAARERGATHLAVEASPESEPILKRLGFVELSRLMFYELDVAKGTSEQQTER
jgi:hypothetical protein